MEKEKIRYSPSTLTVTFNCVDITIEDFLERHGWFGTRVGGVVSRYMVEVPYGQEKEARLIMEQSDIVVKVFKDIIEGRPRRGKRKPREKPSWRA